MAAVKQADFAVVTAIEKEYFHGMLSAERVTRLISMATTVSDPSPHFIVDDALNKSDFDAVIDVLPDPSSMHIVSSFSLPALSEYRDRYSILMEDLIESDHSTVWSELYGLLSSNELEEHTRLRLEPHLTVEARRRLPRRLAPQVWLHCDLAGSYLRPHTDSPNVACVVLLYLKSQVPVPEIGTALYRPIAESAEVVSAPVDSAMNYKHEDRSLFVQTDTVDFVPNRLWGQLRTDFSFHGLEPVPAHAAPRYLAIVQYRLCGCANC